MFSVMAFAEEVKEPQEEEPAPEQRAEETPDYSKYHETIERLRRK